MRCTGLCIRALQQVSTSPGFARRLVSTLSHSNLACQHFSLSACCLQRFSARKAGSAGSLPQRTNRPCAAPYSPHSRIGGIFAPPGAICPIAYRASVAPSNFTV
jgi:hypothetical protein